MSSIAEATGAGGHMRWVILRDLGLGPHSPAGSLNPPTHTPLPGHIYMLLYHIMTTYLEGMGRIMNMCCL